MRIEPWSSGDPALMRGYLRLFRAVRAADDPLGPPVSDRQLRYRLEQSAMPTEAWFVPGPAAGDIQAWCHLRFPDRQNTDLVFTSIVVHPAARRRGTGGVLLRHAAHRATARHRPVLSAWVREGGAGEAFARNTGATASGLTGVRRVQHLAGLPAGRVTSLRAAAAAAAAGYSLETWTGLVPGDRIDQVASVYDALRDAPHGENYEPTIWDAERIQTLVNAEITGLQCRAYWLAVLHQATGEMAALTMMWVDPETPEWGNQEITAVTRPHRGHRLGLLAKTAMLEWLEQEEPAVRHIVTSNAEANQHMIAINDALGYELLEPVSRAWDLSVLTTLARAYISLMSDIWGGSARAGSARLARWRHRANQIGPMAHPHQTPTV